MFKKKSKVGRSDWLAKWLIMSGCMDLRRPRVYRRSNVGLVQILCLKYGPKLAFQHTKLVAMATVPVEMAKKIIFLLKDLRCLNCTIND